MFKEDIKVTNNVEIYLNSVEQKLNWLETLAGECYSKRFRRS